VIPMLGCVIKNSPMSEAVGGGQDDLVERLPLKVCVLDEIVEVCHISLMVLAIVEAQCAG